MHDQNTPPPWYRQFWPWFIISIPLATVIAGIATVMIAVETDDGVVVDDYYKTGLAINQTLTRDKVAAELGLQAEIQIGTDGERARVYLNHAEHAKGLSLRLAYVASPQADQLIALQAGPGGELQADGLELLPGKWYLTLEPEDASWRLTGVMQYPKQASLILKPQALAEGN